MSRTKQRSSIAYSSNSKISFKVIVVGEQGVGKTSLVLRYVKDIFSKDYKVTVGFEFYSKIIKHHDEDVTVQIWDTAGQEAFKSMIRSFYRNSACVILMFSLAKPETLQALNRWVQEVREFSSPEAVVMLVGSKSDLMDNQNSDTLHKAEQFKTKHKLDYFTTISSKNATNIHSLFSKCVDIMHTKYSNNPDFRELVSPNKESFLLPADQTNDNKSKQGKRRCC